MTTRAVIHQTGHKPSIIVESGDLWCSNGNLMTVKEIKRRRGVLVAVLDSADAATSGVFGEQHYLIECQKLKPPNWLKVKPPLTPVETETPCPVDPGTGVVVHRFDAASRVCRCGQKSVETPARRHEWRHPSHWRKARNDAAGS